MNQQLRPYAVAALLLFVAATLWPPCDWGYPIGSGSGVTFHPVTGKQYEFLLSDSRREINTPDYEFGVGKVMRARQCQRRILWTDLGLEYAVIAGLLGAVYLYRRRATEIS